MLMFGKTAFTSDRFNFQGAEYAFNDKRTQVGVWNAQLKDIYSQQYLNLIHSQPVGAWTLGSNLGFFYGKDDGGARAGNLDNRTWSGLLSARYGGNTFYVGLQKLTVHWRNSSMRRDYSNNEFDENRLIVSYPISLL
ncbi:outer membrane porin [Pseudomonas synxantha BG33R]|nr:outer membrane porin [Pseudomonas synxantha BG33R]